MKSTTLNLTWEHERVTNLVLRNGARSTVRDSLWVSRMSRPCVEDKARPTVASLTESCRRGWARSGEGLAYGALAASSFGVLTSAFWQVLNMMA
jgi:hypothetical protein